MCPVKARADQLGHRFDAFLIERVEARVGAELIGPGFGRPSLFGQLGCFAAMTRDFVVRFAIYEGKNREASDEHDHDECSALGATGDPHVATALISWDQVYGSHECTSSAASPAAIARR